MKLFEKWTFEGVKVKDPGLGRYISLVPIAVPSSKGVHEHKRFRKADVSIVDRLVNKLMYPGRSCGKKSRGINIVKNAFEIIHLKSEKNPIQVLVDAVENSAPCEDVTRVSHGGAVYYLAVDVSPQRRVDLALRFLVEGARKKAFSSQQAIEETLANEVIAAAKNDGSTSFAIRRRNEIERIALASR